jgi:hypothetical protein
MGGSRFLGRRLLVEPLRIFVGFARYLVDPLSELRALKNFGGLGHLLLRIAIFLWKSASLRMAFSICFLNSGCQASGEATT